LLTVVHGSLRIVSGELAVKSLIVRAGRQRVICLTAGQALNSRTY